jgi:hypothetical protein
MVLCGGWTLLVGEEMGGVDRREEKNWIRYDVVGFLWCRGKRLRGRGSGRSVYVKLWNGYVLISKIKIKTSLKKAGVPRDEVYILSLCSVASHPHLQRLKTSRCT